LGSTLRHPKLFAGEIATALPSEAAGASTAGANAAGTGAAGAGAREACRGERPARHGIAAQPKRRARAGRELKR
jgi:hypothetical protein